MIKYPLRSLGISSCLMLSFCFISHAQSLLVNPHSLYLQQKKEINVKDDFASLIDHWNFDEARDWHNIEFPFENQTTQALNYCNSNNLSLGKLLSPTKSWVSGKQFSGIKFDKKGQFLQAKKSLNLDTSASLSFWVKIDKKNQTNNGTLIGSKSGLEWGVIQANGTIAFRQNGKVLGTSKSIITDGEWHHIVLIRNSSTGAVGIYVDNKLEVTNKGEKGEIKGNYTKFGCNQEGDQFIGIIDQIHLFNKPIAHQTIETLYTNHAPKIYDQDVLITKDQPSLTGSILCLYAFDPDQDKLTVSRFFQGKAGKVRRSIEDGVFSYTSNEKFTGRDRFKVIVSDGKGGFSTAYMNVHDNSILSKAPTSHFSDYYELPNINQDKKNGYRVPIAYDLDADKKIDLLVCANNRLWFYRNTGKTGENRFATPEKIKNEEGKEIEASSISILNPLKPTSLVIRTPQGQLDIYTRSKNTTLKKLSTILSDNKTPFKAPSNSIAFADWNKDGKIDLLSGEAGGIYLYENTSSKDLILNATKKQALGGNYNLAPYFADLNNDGQLDFLHGINWGNVHYWLNQKEGNTPIDQTSRKDLQLTTHENQAPTINGKDNLLRHMNGTFGTLADFNNDGILDIVLGGHNGGVLAFFTGKDINDAKNNLAKIEQIYRQGGKELGKYLHANNQKKLNEYKKLNRDWISWALSLSTPKEREQAYNQLKRHIAKFPFLKRGPLDAWVKYDKNRQITDIGPMHHVPGIIVMNWITLHQLKPDCLAHRYDVANTLGLKDLDRKQYLSSGLSVADNSKCSDGQMQSILDFMTYHPRILFPDDHISIDQNMGDGREAMSYVFRSNKNTFGSQTGGSACEAAGDIRNAAEKYLGKGKANGDYFTFVMGHEVCHSLDAYVYSRKNKNIGTRWNDMLVFAGNDGGAVDLIVPHEKGVYDVKKTQERFKTEGLWDGKTPWNDTWKTYWDKCSYKNQSFMRGNIGWFLDTKQETLATQANHHWAGSEARLVGALDRYYRGHKSNITEVLFFLDLLSAGLNKIPMYNFTFTKGEKTVTYAVDKAWLERTDQGYINKITINDRIYEFDVDTQGRVQKIIRQPFEKEMAQIK